MLSLNQAAVTYPSGITALFPTSLAFVPGQFTVLIGASGAGKSTLLRCLNGLVRPTHGEVLAAGTSIFASRRALRHHRCCTGMIFQQHHLIGRLTALQNVLMGRLSAHSFVRSLFPLPRADRLLALSQLDRVGLLDRALDRADQLSGGQQQRVGIARAMAQCPTVVLADEPVASLDPAGAERVLCDLHRICREDRITAIVSLHQVDFACRFGDRVIGLAKGRVVFDGRPGQLDRTAFETVYETRTELAEAAE